MPNTIDIGKDVCGVMAFLVLEVLSKGISGRPEMGTVRTIAQGAIGSRTRVQNVIAVDVRLRPTKALVLVAENVAIVKQMAKSIYMPGTTG